MQYQLYNRMYSTTAAGLFLLLLHITDRTFCDENFSNSESMESLISFSNSTSTTISATTTVNSERVENFAIFGCRWPDDFVERFTFCTNKSQVVSANVGNVTGENDLKYGILDREILKFILDECTEESIFKCVAKVDKYRLEGFRKSWMKNVNKYQDFAQCLQSNTEAMNRLCGSDTPVSQLISGAAGLHLNLINVLIRVEKERTDANISDFCYLKVAEVVHLTAALYLESKTYLENSVFCWNAVIDHCDEMCSAFASQLNCLHSTCQSLPISVLQEFGIWQWYFLNTMISRKHCDVKEEECSVNESNDEAIQVQGIATLFDRISWKKRMHKMAVEIEHTFGVSFSAVITLILAAFAAFLTSCTALCAFKYGLCTKNKNRHYSRLENGSNESQSLTKSVEMDD